MPNHPQGENELNRRRSIIIHIFLLGILLTACHQDTAPSVSTSNPLAIESFLADLAQNVAGERMAIQSLIPPGLDPHNFEVTPKDVVRINDSSILIINGANLESWLMPILENLPKDKLVITASEGLISRTSSKTDSEIDPHFWLDPINVIQYVKNIRDGLIKADPDGKVTYENNAEAYIEKLNDLDLWIKEQVALIPPSNRKLVTNHESLDYFADRYGFEVIGTIIPSTSTGSSPSAEELAKLVDIIRSTGVKAIFLEAGGNSQLAEQVANETGIKVVADLYTHSIPTNDGFSASYLEMMKHDVSVIVEALR